MKLSMSQKVSLAQLGLTEQDQYKMCLLAKKIRARTNSMLAHEAKKIRKLLRGEREN